MRAIIMYIFCIYHNISSFAYPSKLTFSNRLNDSIQSVHSYIASLLQGPLFLSTVCAIPGGGMAHCSIGHVALNGKMPNCGGTI